MLELVNNHRRIWLTEKHFDISVRIMDQPEFCRYQREFPGKQVLGNRIIEDKSIKNKILPESANSGNFQRKNPGQ